MTAPSTRFLLMSTTALLTCAPLVSAITMPTRVERQAINLILDGNPSAAPREFDGLLSHV